MTIDTMRYARIFSSAQSSQLMRAGALLVTAALLLVLFSGRAGAAPELRLAWSGPGEKGSEVFYGEVTEGRLSVPQQVSSGPLDSIAPALTVDSGGRVWMAWIQVGGGGSSLAYSVLSGGMWSEPAAVPTGMTAHSGVTLLVDGGGTPWIAWAGHDGGDDDIFAVRFLGKGWSPPFQAGRDNEVPDVHPLLALGAGGEPWICWQSFDGSGYSTLKSRWSGSEWEPAATAGEDDPCGAALTDNLRSLPSPGAFGLDDEDTAVYRGGSPFPSLPAAMRKFVR